MNEGEAGQNASSSEDCSPQAAPLAHRTSLSPPPSEEPRRQKARPPCKFYLTRRGCAYGSDCNFSHSSRRDGGKRADEAETESERERPVARKRRPAVCRQYLAPGGCRYGERCKYRHVSRQEAVGGGDGGVGEEMEKLSVEGEREKPAGTGQKSAVLDLTSFPGLAASGSKAAGLPTQSSQTHTLPHTSQPQKTHNKRHAPSELSLGSFMTTSTAAMGTRSHPPVERPQRSNRKTTVELREAELEQLETRFQGNHRLVEKGSERSVYRVTFAPTDPDWNFKFATVELEVTFPRNYPTVPLQVKLPNDQGLHPIYINHGNLAVSRYLATAQGGTGELMFRPFLRWLDRTLTSVFRDAAKQVTADLFGNENEETTPPEGHTHSDSEEDEEESDLSGDEGENEQSEEGSDNQEMPTTVSTDKRGTEMRLSGMVMSEGVGVGRCAAVRVTLQCTRCRAQQDETIRADNPTSQLCSQCQHCYSFAYRPAIFHPTSPTLGFLDLQGCQPVDLVLMQCETILTCLECGRDNTTSGLNYGEHRDLWCKRCHVKLSLCVDQCRFVQHQPGALPTALGEGRRIKGERKKKAKDGVIQVGKPLPEFGTCAHYKKSNRWLRFPCCGKPFPCDTCHDETEDHVMERANRMICGFCAREQTYSSSRPCVGCGGDLVGGRAGAYWEGGKGCRNKVKMSRNDIHKYTNSTDKTKCKKQERVGKHSTPVKS